MCQGKTYKNIDTIIILKYWLIISQIIFGISEINRLLRRTLCKPQIPPTKIGAFTGLLIQAANQRIPIFKQITWGFNWQPFLSYRKLPRETTLSWKPGKSPVWPHMEVNVVSFAVTMEQKYIIETNYNLIYRERAY